MGAEKNRVRHDEPWFARETDRQQRRRLVDQGKCPLCLGPLTDGMMCPDTRHTSGHGEAWFDPNGNLVTEPEAREAHYRDQLFRNIKMRGAQ